MISLYSVTLHRGLGMRPLNVYRLRLSVFERVQHQNDYIYKLLVIYIYVFRHCDTLNSYCIHFGTSCLVPKCLGAELSWCRSVLTPTFSSDWRYIVFLQMLVALKRAGCDGNLTVKQATSQHVFKMTISCTDTHFLSFSPLINRMVRLALLKFSPCLDKLLPQLVRIADCYSILLRHAPDAVI